MINELIMFMWSVLALLVLVSMFMLWPHIQKSMVSFAGKKHPQVEPDYALAEQTGHQQQEQEQQAGIYREIFECTPECMLVQTQAGNIQHINPAGVALLEMEQHYGTTNVSMYKFIAAKYRHAYRGMTEKVFNGEPDSLEYEIITGKGRRRWVRTYAVPLLNSRQQVVNIIANSHDITQARIKTFQLEAQRKKLQTIIESEPECVKLQDARGCILEMNPAGLSLLDAAGSEDVVGESIYKFMAPEYVDAYRLLTKKVFEGGRGSMAFEVVSLNGRRRWLETHAAPLLDNVGEVGALLAITRDIDGRKKSEERLRQQQAELAHVCRLSTMGEMASSLAHELNQPLCAVSSYAESARMINKSQSPALNELLDKIVHQGRRATQIIQNLREFVRKQAPSPEVISVSSIVENVIEFVDLDQRRGKVQMQCHIDNELGPVMADRIQIEQVLLNIISNAFQAMCEPGECALAEGERQMSIEVVQISSEEIQIKVCNTGPAIPDAVAKELFTPFFTTRATGMGMGLSISRSIVEAHGGRIWHVTESKAGTCFCFTLPTITHG